MVTPIRDLGNKFSFTMKNTSPMLTFELPTVSFTSYTGMDLPSESYSDNYDEVRGRTPFTNKNTSRDSLISFTCCGNHLSQRTNDLQRVNLLGGYIVGSSQENSTRSLC